MLARHVFHCLMKGVPNMWGNLIIVETATKEVISLVFDRNILISYVYLKLCSMSNELVEHVPKST